MTGKLLRHDYDKQTMVVQLCKPCFYSLKGERKEHRGDRK